MIFALVTLAAFSWLFVIVYASAWLASKFFLPLQQKNFDADEAALR